jgi:signal transduction histidine kinase/ActR/RegA family two-component response regulator
VNTETRVLVYALSPTESALAVRVLAASGLQAQAIGAPAQLRSELAAGAGALLVMEEVLTGAVVAAVTDHLAAQPAWSDLPILVATKSGADSTEAHGAVVHLGNVTLLERPVRTMALASAARSALRSRKRQYEVRALNARKDQLLATLAHELRNPLAPISNAAAVLQRLFPAPQAANLVQIIQRQTTHLTRLVDDLLDVARITSGKLTLQLAPTTLSQVITHALEIAGEAIRSRQHTLAVDQPQVPVRLLADHVRLVQAVSNLLLNAAKFTPAGGEIALRAEVHGPAVEFTVRDSGRGIDAEALERIFDMFEQSRAVGEPSGGLGLGLHLVRAASAGLGHGSEFTLSLPVVQHDQAEGQLSDAAAARPALPQRVLVVDDNVDAARTLQTLLALHGVQVSVVHDGAQAVETVGRELPEAVVMDIGMPVMNGYEAARRIRARHSPSEVMLIALTGWGQYADRARATEAGFDFHFVKPLEVEALMACLAGQRT